MKLQEKFVAFSAKWMATSAVSYYMGYVIFWIFLVWLINKLCCK